MFYISAVRYLFKSPDDQKPLSGVLLLNRDDHPRDGPISAAIFSSDEAYLKVRAACRFLDRHMFRPMLGHSIFLSPEYTALLLIVLLTCERWCGYRPHDWIMKRLLTMSSGKLPAKGFIAFVKELREKIATHGLPPEFR